MKLHLTDKKVIIGLLCSALLLALAVRRVEWAQTWRALGNIEPRRASLGGALLIAAWLVFAVRWQAILARAARVPVGDTFSCIMIGFLANTVLPLRLGDVSRAVMLGRKTEVSASTALGSIMVERALDICAVLTVGFAVSFLMPIPTPIKLAMTSFAVAGLGLLIVLFTLAGHGGGLQSLVARLTGAFGSDRLKRLAAHELIARLAQGAEALRSPAQAARVLGYSILGWGLAALSTMSFLAAFHLPVPWFAGLFVLTVINLGGAIPSSPGGIGVYHYLMILALSTWAIDQSVAFGFAVATHGITTLLYLLLGGSYLAKEGLSLRALNDLPATAEVAR